MPEEIKATTKEELPPRTRRIRMPNRTLNRILGTTSAHAENTLGFIGDDRVYRNYLRARGEYHAYAMTVGNSLELPPRTRRILVDDR